MILLIVRQFFIPILVFVENLFVAMTVVGLESFQFCFTVTLNLNPAFQNFRVVADSYSSNKSHPQFDPFLGIKLISMWLDFKWNMIWWSVNNNGDSYYQASINLSPV